jgi:hypothetical protein
MVRDNRIKEYRFVVASGNANHLTQYTNHILNGEILRIDNYSNYTGSIQLYVSGQTVKMTDFTSTSGTGKWEYFPLTNTTGSFVVNAPMQLVTSGTASGTNVVIGPISILYR